MIQFVFATAGCSFFMIYHWSFISHWSARYGVLPIAQAGFGTVAPVSGTFVGWGLFCVFVSLGVVDRTLIIVIALIFLFANILVASIMPYGSELRIVDAERPIEDNPNDGTSIWKSSLRHIAVASGLTPREREIFALLARGRNIGYISNRLVISSHTTKSHVYRIYSKLNINSQQELISLAENYAEEIRRITQ
jgi:DNA-binding CsgD family transcriptional regulator